MGPGAGGGAPLGEVESAPSLAWARQLWARLWDLGQAWRGGEGAILAPRDWSRLGRRSRRALAVCCLCPDAGPRGRAVKLHPRPWAPSPPASLAAQVCRPEMQRSFLIFQKEALGLHSFSGVGVGVCIGNTGPEISPLQAAISVPKGVGMSYCNIGGFSESLRFPICRQGKTTFPIKTGCVSIKGDG